MNLSHLTPSERRRVEAFYADFAVRYGYPNGLPAGMEPEDAIRGKVTKPALLLNLICNTDGWLDRRLGEAFANAIERDDIHACDLLRDVLNPLIDAEVDRLAKHEGVGAYFDLMAVAA